MEFEGDAFISYAIWITWSWSKDARAGSPTCIGRSVRVGQLLGKKPQIRDPKLAGNDFLEETLFERLRTVAVLISVVSPRYIRSVVAQGVKMSS
jgi:hypothetical protein